MILFIDDEPRIMDSYRLYLELELAPHGYEVVFHSKVDEAFEFFEKHLDAIDLVILDIMMPTGKRFSSLQTDWGLRTGIAFYEEIRVQQPTIPVLIFTNYFDEDVEKRFRQDRNCRFCQKADYLLDEFVREVEDMLSRRAR